MLKDLLCELCAGVFRFLLICCFLIGLIVQGVVFMLKRYWYVWAAVVVGAVAFYDLNPNLGGIEPPPDIVIPEEVLPIPPKDELQLIREKVVVHGEHSFPVQVWFHERDRALYIILFHPNSIETAIFISVSYGGMYPRLIWVHDDIMEIQDELFPDEDLPVIPQMFTYPERLPEGIRKQMYREDI